MVELELTSKRVKLITPKEAKKKAQKLIDEMF